MLYTSTMSFIRSLADISSKDVASAGGKGASLGEMINAGIPVPPGFVVVAKAFDAFLKETELVTEIDAMLGRVNINAMHTVEDASEKIQALIENATMPTDIAKEILKAHKTLGARFVAVRSSATAEDSAAAAWAGQLETHLNVQEKTLLKEVQKCWASLFSPRAIFYRFEQKLQKKKISVAVAVQEMVESEKSGVAFSVHPVTQDRNQMIIEAAFGLGEALVSGMITPDSFVIRKDNSAIIDIQIHEQTKGMFRGKDGGTSWQTVKKKDKASLSASEVKEFAKLLLKIEKHYGFPVDVEWAQVKGKFFILQSRPITTLQASTSKPSITFEFSWGEKHSVMTTEMWLSSYVRFRDLPANENQHVAMDVHNGHVSTFNAAEEMPAAYEAGKAFIEPKFLPWYLKKSTSVRDRFEELRQKVEKTNLTKLSNEKLADFLDDYQKLFHEVYALFKISQPEYQLAASDHLRSLLKKIFKKESDLESAFIALTSPTEMDMMKEEELTAMEISLKRGSVEKDIKRYAERFSWFFFNTYERKTIREFLENRFAELQKIPKKERQEFIREAEESVVKQKKVHAATLKKVKNDPEIAYLSSLFGTLGNDRLELKIWWTGSEYLFLSLFEEIANRLDLSTEEFLMTYRLKEAFSALREGLRIPLALRTSRKKRYACVLDGDRELFLEAEEALMYAKKHNLVSAQASVQSAGKTLKGVVANTGKATGTARVIHVESLKELLHDMKRFGDGDIIVTTMTQPSIVSIARKATAIVTNEGGITSHASILAREFGIPCVVGTKSATQMIKDGDTIEVDANRGTVTILS